MRAQNNILRWGNEYEGLVYIYQLALIAVYPTVLSLHNTPSSLTPDNTAY